jgi:hypothetical protein
VVAELRLREQIAGERGSVEDRSAGRHAAVRFFDQPAGVTRFKPVHTVWRRQRMEVLPDVAYGE